MPSIQIKDVPADVHAKLRARAAADGKSLQEYLLDRLRADSERPTLGELFARVAQHTGGEASLQEATDAVRTDRDSR